MPPVKPDQGNQQCESHGSVGTKKIRKSVRHKAVQPVDREEKITERNQGKFDKQCFL